MYMARNVALSEEAYAKLGKNKRGEESFSDVVLRLLEKKNTASWRKSVGSMRDEESVRIFDKILESRHSNTPRGPRFKW